jgi:hypothetical protein
MTTGLKVFEVKDKVTGEVYWRALSSGVPSRSDPTGRRGVIQYMDAAKEQK